MYTMFLSLKKLYENELYANVLPIGSILVTAYNHDRSVLTPEQYFMMLAYYASSLFEDRQYRRAEEYFTQALQAKKSVMKLKSSFATTVFETGTGSGVSLFPESELRYKLALCMEATRQIPEAVVVLQALSSKQRSPKINMLLAKLLQHNGYNKGAIVPLKAALKECPLNLEAIKGLLALGIKSSEINQLIGDAGLSIQCTDWLGNYIAAYAHMYACRFPEAIVALQSIESKPGIGDNEMILVLIGQCYHYIGNHDTALYYLMRAHNSNNHLTDGLMTLAALYAIKNRIDDLEKLTIPTVAPPEHTAEYWFVLAQHLFAQGKHDKAAYFAQKSCFLNPKNNEATLLKVKIFMHMKKYKEAIVHLRIMQQFAAYRFEVYEGLVDAYIATHRLREAAEISRTGVRRQGANISARSFVLLARPYYSHDDPQQKVKAKTLLARALANDEYYLPAVLMMIDTLQEEGDVAGATKLIKKQLLMQPNSKLYSMLGDILSKEKDQTKAVENYTIAINMDPTNRKAVAGLIAMGQSLNTKTDSSYNSAQSPGAETGDFQENNTFEIVEIAAPVPDAESESDTLWSDVEVEINTSN